MRQKKLTLGIVPLVAFMMMAVYLFEVHYERIGEGLVLTNEAVAADQKPVISATIVPVT